MDKSDGFVLATVTGPFGRSEAGNLLTIVGQDYVWWINGHEKVFLYCPLPWESMPGKELYLSEGDKYYCWSNVESLEAATELAQAILAGTARPADETV